MAKNKTRSFTVKTFSEQEFNSTSRKLASYLRATANRRSTGVVTADDVHNYLSRMGVREQQVRTRLSFINSVLRTPNFEPVDVVSSSRPQAKGRAITAWAAL